MSERLDIRLSDEEKEKLAEIAKSKGMSMTELVRTWIIKGDIAFVLAEQLSDFASDFAKWHVLEDRDTSILYLGRDLRHGPGPTPPFFYIITDFFVKSAELIRDDMRQLQRDINVFIKKTEPKEKEKLIALIAEFTSIVEKYYRIYVETFIEMFNALPEEYPRSSVEAHYNDGFRIRYNEFASKYEDFLKRASRELGADIAKPIQRAKELRAKRKL